MIFNKTLLMIDGHNLIRRNYEGIQIEDEEKRIKATISATLNTLSNLIKKHCPTYFMMVLDHGGPTFRHEIYPEYKQGRTPMPDALATAIKDLADRLNSQLNLFTTSVPGVEAEDVIATISLKAKKRGISTIINSNDKDLICLVSHGIEVWDKEVNRTAEFVEEKYKIYPRQMEDYLALMGDTVDGVPGVPRVGSATAAKLLGQFDTLENIVSTAKANPELFSGKLGTHIQSNVEFALLSKKLTSLKIDVDISIKPSEIRVPEDLRVLLLEHDGKINAETLWPENKNSPASKTPQFK